MIVVDNSMLMAALFDDERVPFAMKLREDVVDRKTRAYVPPIFLYEAYNSVLQAVKRKRIDENICQQYFEHISAFPITVDLFQKMPAVAALAFKHNLSMYDASYLELCVREKLPLATYDSALIAAAKKEKIGVVN